MMITRTAGDVLAELKMARAAFSGALLVLEGASDSLFWRGKILKNGCQITISGGKTTALKVAEVLDAENFSGFLVVVDDDYDFFLGKSYDSDNLLFTETNDLETLIFSSPALDKVLSEFVGGVDGNARLGETVSAVKSAGIFFGRLRYLNRERSLNVSFEMLSPWKYMDVATLALNEDELLQDFSRLANVREDLVRSWFSGVPDEPVWNIVQGHDFACILSIAMRGMCSRACTEKAIYSSLRLAYELAWFKATTLVESIFSWEQRQKLAVLA